MLDHEIMTPPPPTPHELLKVLVEVYGPPPDHNNPFHSSSEIARMCLTVEMLQDAFGPTHPLSKIASVAHSVAMSPYQSESQSDGLQTRLTTATKQLIGTLP